MLNPMPKIEPPTKTEKVKTALTKTGKTFSRERDLVLAVFFLVMGFVAGRL